MDCNGSGTCVFCRRGLYSGCKGTTAGGARSNIMGFSPAFPGVQALDNVDFEVYPGEVLGFVGENGAGKSTLIKILSGVYHKDQGTIWLSGNEVTPRSPQEAQNLGISTIYQELALVPHLTVAENIFLNREPRRVPAIGMVDFRKMNQQAEEILHDLGADVPVNKSVRELPVAAQQMVEIAKALSVQARVLIMDEPTSSLSAKESESLFNLIEALRGTHLIRAEQRAGSTWYLRSGRLHTSELNIAGLHNHRRTTA